MNPRDVRKACSQKVPAGCSELKLLYSVDPELLSEWPYHLISHPDMGSPWTLGLDLHEPTEAVGSILNPHVQFGTLW